MRLPGNKWLEEKHKTKAKRRSWRKLHLGLDLVSGEIVCADLTMDDVGNPTALPGLLAARFGSTIEVAIPPPKNAILSPNAAQDPTARDWHITEIAACGRMAWQKATGYNQRSRGETLPLMHAPHTLPGSAWVAGRLLLVQS